MPHCRLVRPRRCCRTASALGEPETVGALTAPANKHCTTRLPPGVRARTHLIGPREHGTRVGFVGSACLLTCALPIQRGANWISSSPAFWWLSSHLESMASACMGCYLNHLISGLLLFGQVAGGPDSGMTPDLDQDYAARDFLPGHLPHTPPPLFGPPGADHLARRALPSLSPTLVCARCSAQGADRPHAAVVPRTPAHWTCFPGPCLWTMWTQRVQHPQVPGHFRRPTAPAGLEETMPEGGRHEEHCPFMWCSPVSPVIPRLRRDPLRPARVPIGH